ncbi:hypothetical protein PHLGIDRAFT_25794 [Phlebiopsis gigantea 11061_1 CR5-6]|uniref:Autophagy-related protein 27 n=1 Tax=Phlebiopsis gigantea (strain 11061_1 CR5-6) TaxID=745531 RepID=A0A0C3S2Y6_PHLG1|nr:hypothetical protein PHLGIDRAFT_25794 [Phlebiopsis gigantea 11061_1 CR5-6]
MSLIPLTLCLVSLFAAIALGGDTVQLDSLVQQCRFMVDGITFDLCPLFGTQEQKVWATQWTRETPPTVTSSWYKFSIDGPIPRNESRPASMQCPEGTWICLTTWNRPQDKTWREGRLLNTVPIAGSLSPGENDPLFQRGEYTPGLRTAARMVPGSFVNADGDVLSIRLHGGYYVDTEQHAVIYFVCDRDYDNSKFVHVHTHDGGHLFAWKTPHACAVSREGQPDSPKEENPEDLAPPILSKRPSLGYWAAMISSAYVSRASCSKTHKLRTSFRFAIAVVAYLIYSPPRWLRRQIQQYLKNHPSLLRFRVGESVLVRWAHEDVLLDDMDDETVVNGDDVNYVYEEEQIPLKPSPRKSGIVTYGSTR